MLDKLKSKSLKSRSLQSKSLKNNTKRNLKKFKQEIVIKFLEMLNVVKIYHWKTNSYTVHKATDELYERLNEHIDHFVEVLLGKDESRVDLMKVKTLDITDYNDISLFTPLHI